MTTERRDDGTIYWTSKKLKIEESGPHSPLFEFYDDEYIQRFAFDWPDVWDNGREGWIVGHSKEMIFIGASKLKRQTLVVFDGRKGVEGLPPGRVKKI